MTERNRIKKKIQSIDSKKWWGDDFDVRFYLISQIQKIKNSKILDIGGGIGIISSEFDKSNLCVNLDSSFKDLIICKNKMNTNIHNVCASMINLPFKESSFEYTICANILEVGKSIDCKNKKSNQNYPSINKILNESKRILKCEGNLLITTPNNSYYNSEKLTYKELHTSLNKVFSSFEIMFFNTFPKLHKTQRKLNLANIIPKISAKFLNPDKIISKLITKKSKNNYSVSFFVKIKKN